jgi:MFS family permease
MSSLSDTITFPNHQDRRSLGLIVTASALGTAFEWFDFYVYALLTINISSTFFSGVNETTGYILALATFSAGFAIRPFGALVFGRIGDLVGRKYTFLVTMAIMGLGTFTIGLLPSYAKIGIASPILLVVLRLLQGLSIGGEFGGAATYVAEHAPNNRRGLYTGWIQTMAPVGLVTAQLVVIGAHSVLGAIVFDDWGWRIPFLASILFLAVSMWLRLKLSESPVYQKMKERGTTSKAPVTESFGQWKNLRWVLVVLFGAIIGQTVVGYTGYFYSLFFLEKTLKVGSAEATVLIATATGLAIPLVIFFGWLSDKIGRKPILLAGCALAAISYFPLFNALTEASNPEFANAQASVHVVVFAHQEECSLQFDPVGKNHFDKSSCDVVKAALAKAGIPYSNQDAPAGNIARVELAGTTIVAPDTSRLPAAERISAIAAFQESLRRSLNAAGYPNMADPAKMSRGKIVGILFLMQLYIGMVIGPMSAMLVEMFPSRIRYTSMSLPYHLGNGWIGGLLPMTAFAMVTATGDIYYGLWYPVVFAGLAAVIGLVFLPETYKRDIGQ